MLEMLDVIDVNSLNRTENSVKKFWKAREVLVEDAWKTSRFSTRAVLGAGFAGKLDTETYRKLDELSAGTGRGMRSQHSADLGEMLPKGRFGALGGFHAFAGVKHGAMMASSEKLGDGQQ